MKVVGTWWFIKGLDGDYYPHVMKTSNPHYYVKPGMLLLHLRHWLRTLG